MKLAVSGKGGVGKTTTSALIALALHRAGHDVLAIDADPDSNLLACMGHADPSSVRPLVEMKDLIEERTGAKPGSVGGMFKLNPLVEDLPEKYSVCIGGVRILVAGAIKNAGAGCYCPENALLRALVGHLLLDGETSLVLDMEAGVEHLTRGTVNAVDHLLIVADPSRRSVETALRIERLAGEIGIERVGFVGNRVRDAADKAFLQQMLPEGRLVGCVPFDQRIREADRNGTGIGEVAESVEEAVSDLVTFLEKAN